MGTVRVALGGLVLLPVAVLLGGCGGDDSGPSASDPSATVTVTQTATPAPIPTLATSPSSAPTPTPTPVTGGPSPTPQRGFPCDPDGGYPKPSASCPYGDPLTGFDGTTITLKPFHTYYNDAEGKAYARKHHLRYPFDDDHYDAPDGPPRSVQASPDTICTGIILVGSHTATKDHKVPCAALEPAVDPEYGVPAALWLDGDHLVQLSELFRP